MRATEGQELKFGAQGPQDGKWETGNVWTGNLVYLSDAPQDGVYSCSCVSVVTEDMVKVSKFDVGFRCDYWASGSFRVRNVKIEKGEIASEWSPGV